MLLLLLPVLVGYMLYLHDICYQLGTIGTIMIGGMVPTKLLLCFWHIL